MNPTTKYVEDESLFQASVLNVPLYEIDSSFNTLENRINTYIENKDKLVLLNQPLDASMVTGRVVTWVEDKWEVLSINYLDEIPEQYAVGVCIEITSSTVGHRYGVVCLGGYLPIAMETDDPSISFGVPYYLAANGKVSATPTDRAIYIGTFISATEFILNIQLWLNAHSHHRILADKDLWEDHTTYILYPFSGLGQLPRPAESIVFSIAGQFCPLASTYTVDADGIKITDISAWETLLSTSPLFTYLSGSDSIEIFWSNPRNYSLPGIIALTAATSNLSIATPTPGNLEISSLPVFETQTEERSGYKALKRISTLSTGVMRLEYGPVIESLVAGENISISTSNGIATVSANSSSGVEEEFTEILLRGALTKIYPGTINEYIEFNYTYANSVILKKYFGSATSIEIYIRSFSPTVGSCTYTYQYSFPVNISSSYATNTKTVAYGYANRLQKDLIARIIPTSGASSIHFSIGRGIDSVFQASTGVEAFIIKVFK